MRLDNVTLELSAKPFRDESDECAYAVARAVFGQWKPLIDAARGVSVMLWIADGSEILEYTGDLDQTFEWAYWIGCANPLPFDPVKDPKLLRSTHYVPAKYIPDAAPRPYRWLKRIIEILRRVGAEVCGKPVRVGATFDNGPEFAVSDFKYRRHREIAQAHTLYPNSFVTCDSLLAADSKAYAAFPGGIAEGTSLGAFLGAQFGAFARDLGYDYLWLSNGMGFGTETWGVSGALFDRRAFYPEKAPAAAEAMLRFWRDLHAAAPGLVIETRGSNFSAGVEIASDAAPLRELYRDFKIAPPVNSPWAALNFHSGLELAAWMSHVATLPDGRFPFRFYIHDPWFLNSPWLDRYGREPWDIYLPLSVARLDEKGEVQTPNSIAFLTVDDTLGRTPDQVPMEVIPHLYEAFDRGPDEAGPFVWVYPFAEYNDFVRDGLPGGGPRIPDAVFNEDQYLGFALEAGFPLNTVVNTENFRALAAAVAAGDASSAASSASASAFARAVMVVPASALFVDNNRAALQTLLARGGRALVYGPLNHAPQALFDLLGLSRAEALDGGFVLEHALADDEYEVSAPPDTFHVHAPYCGGGLVEAPRAASADGGGGGDGGGGARILATAAQGGQRRVLASAKDHAGGRLVYVRSVLPCPTRLSENSRKLELPGPGEASPVQRLMRLAMAEFGWSLRFRGFDADAPPPRLCLSRHDGALFASVFSPDTTAELWISTPLGAPLAAEMATRVENDAALWHPGKSWRKECRCFARQKDLSVIDAKTVHPAYPGYEARWYHRGFKNADVCFLPPKGARQRLEITVSAGANHELLSEDFREPEWLDTPLGPCARIKNFTGNLLFSWRTA